MNTPAPTPPAVRGAHSPWTVVRIVFTAIPPLSAYPRERNTP